jgi:Family of unknown function (DUF6932)
MPDYPPLLESGFHEMTPAQVRDLCVARAQFKMSTTRNTIMDCLDQVIGRLSTDGVQGDLWIDGSFLTEKINPRDADIVLRVSANFYNLAPAPALAAMDWLETDLKTPLRIDSYLSVEHAAPGPGILEPLWELAYWVRQFGWSREDEPKGMALVKLPLPPPPAATPSRASP